MPRIVCLNAQDEEVAYISSLTPEELNQCTVTVYTEDGYQYKEWPGKRAPSWWGRQLQKAHKTWKGSSDAEKEDHTRQVLSEHIIRCAVSPDIQYEINGMYIDPLWLTVDELYHATVTSHGDVVSAAKEHPREWCKAVLESVVLNNLDAVTFNDEETASYIRFWLKPKEISLKEVHRAIPPRYRPAKLFWLNLKYDLDSIFAKM